MHIDRVKGAVHALLEIMRDMDLEMCVAIAILQTRAKPLRRTDPPLEEQRKELAKEPESKRVVDEKYASVLAMVDKILDEKELLDFLAQWRPRGREN
jgi:hypothetical protein